MIFTIIIFFVLEFSYYKVKETYIKIKKIQESIEKSNNVVENKKEIKAKENKETKEDNINENIWQIEIPKIKLVAPIAEGTSQEVMLEYVGHFESTEILYGNVGLAAHNRGFPINYFEKLKELIEGDEIIYKTKYGEKTYKVVLSTIITDTDWSYLQQDTDKNTITLITCVENEPNKRRCIQGIENK